MYDRHIGDTCRDIIMTDMKSAEYTWLVFAKDAARFQCQRWCLLFLDELHFKCLFSNA